MSRYATLRQAFERRHVDVSKPGFYNAAQLSNADLRQVYEDYAEYVLLQPLSRDYLDRARREIPLIVRILKKEMVADGREGACIDASIIICKILEREGFWNFIGRGSLRVEVPGRRPWWHWTYDFGDFVAGHAWVVAPPFQIIDLTVDSQEHLGNLKRLLPAEVVSEGAKGIQASLWDLMNPDFAKINGIPPSSTLQQILPQIAFLHARIPAVSVSVKGISLAYFPDGVAFPDAELEDLENWKVNGRHGFDLYKDLVLPALAQLRSGL